MTINIYYWVVTIRVVIFYPYQLSQKTAYEKSDLFIYEYLGKFVPRVLNCDLVQYIC